MLFLPRSYLPRPCFETWSNLKASALQSNMSLSISKARPGCWRNVCNDCTHSSAEFFGLRVKWLSPHRKSQLSSLALRSDCAGTTTTNSVIQAGYKIYCKSDQPGDWDFVFTFLLHEKCTSTRGKELKCKSRNHRLHTTHLACLLWPEAPQTIPWKMQCSERAVVERPFEESILSTRLTV